MNLKRRKSIVVFVLLPIILISIIVAALQFGLDDSAQSAKAEKNLLFTKILADENKGAAPHEVKFNSLIINGNGNIKYEWDFGDGEASDDANPKHIYKQIGSYTCKLTVTDVDGKITTDYVNITVSRNNPPLVKIVVDKVTGNRPTTINFDASVFDVDGEIVSYEWEVTEPPFFSRQKVTKYNEKNFSKTFIRNGFYEVKLTVVDDAGNAVTEYLKLQIQKSRPELVVDSITGLINRALYYYGQIQNLVEILGKVSGS